MKALVIAPQPFFSPRGTPLSVYYRTLVMSELGVEIDLLTYGEGQDVTIPNVRIIRIPRFAVLGNVTVGPSLLKLFLDSWLFLRAFFLLLRKRYDVVHAHEEAVFMALLLKPIFRFKLIYDMHSSLPQQLQNFRYSNSRLIVGVFNKLEQAGLRRSDAVITICPALAEYAKRMMADPNKQFLIENSLFGAVHLVEPCAPDLEREPQLPSGSPIVLYAGTFEAYQGVDLLIRAFADVCQQVPNAVLLLVGGTQQQVCQMKRLAKEVNVVEKCTFTGRLPTESTTRLMSSASVLVSPRVTGTNSPLKIYAHLASGIVMVATDIYSHTQILDQSVCFLVDPNAPAMANGIVSALTDRHASEQRIRNAQLLFERNYSRKIYVKKMQAMLHSLECSAGDIATTENMSNSGRLNIRVLDIQDTACRDQSRIDADGSPQC